MLTPTKRKPNAAYCALRVWLRTYNVTLFCAFLVKNVEKSGFLLTKICFAERKKLMIGEKIERQKRAFCCF